MFDLNVVLMIIFSEFCIVVGSNWSGAERHKLHLLEQKATRNVASANENGSTSQRTKNKKSKQPLEKMSALHLSLTNVIVYVGLMSVLLLALYWFFKYLIFMLLGLFMMGSLVSVFTCVQPILKFVIPNAISSFNTFVSISISISLTATWFLLRHSPCGWIWHDLVGFCFVVCALKNIRLPNFRLICWLLSLLFIYDIFFVFITPLFTSDGSSVMVKVAVGENYVPKRLLPSNQLEHTPLVPNTNQTYWNNGERVPMVFRLPYIENSTWQSCLANTGFLFLGYGDILVPGLLVSYANFHDRLYSIPNRPYFTISCICYALGLVLTSVFVYLIEGTGQPALLYLVPATIIPVSILALYRHEWFLFWNGPPTLNLNDQSAQSSSKMESESFQNEPELNSNKESPINSQVVVSAKNIKSNDLPPV